VTEENDLIKERYKKLEGLKALGVDAYGGAFAKREFIAALLGSFEEKKQVRTAGRISAMRFMGKSVFADLKDETAKIQLYLKKDHLSELDGKVFDLLDIGDILGVEGEFFKTKTGQISIRVEKLTLLAKSLRPMPEKWHGLKDIELRYRQRYLDLISNDTTKDIFKKRSLVIRSLRRHLDDQGYLEVETPMMHPIPGGAAGKPFKTHHEALSLDLFLRVAPELYLKRLLVGGFDRVYEINKSFRNEGISTRHNPEFTMLEVYTAYHDMKDVMALCQELVQQAALASFGSLQIEFDGKKLDLEDWEHVSFKGLMKKNFDISPADPTAAWIQKLKKKGVEIPSKDGKDISRTQLINLVGELLEPGTEMSKAGRPIFVTEYFSELSPLARNNQSDPLISDRFELYIGGMEIANGYSEQNDPLTQKKRFIEELEEMGRQGEKGSLDEDYIHALEHGMPPAGGLGIGIDRLVMILTGQPSIREVILFPQMKKEA
jgi:lysyl-tRNA synthetase class 2